MIRSATLATAIVMLAMTSLAAADHQDEAKEKKEPKTLTIGDPAPPIQIQHWLKGEEVEAFEEGKVYVLEFWATWCGPCIAAMPHLSELQDKYRDYDVTIIGISDEKLQTVVGFLTQEQEEDTLWYEAITYTLTTSPDRKTHDAYMRAAAQRGIPTSFIIGKTGKVEWIGHPMGMDDPLEAIVRDEWDREPYRAEFEERQEANRAMMMADRAMSEAAAEGDWDRYFELIDGLIEENPQYADHYRLQRFRTMLRELDDADRAYAYGRELVEANDENPFLLAQIAMTVAGLDDESARDLDFALATAKLAVESANSDDPYLLHALASVHHARGDRDLAIKMQRQAVELADDDRFRNWLNSTLEKYEAEDNDF